MINLLSLRFWVENGDKEENFVLNKYTYNLKTVNIFIVIKTKKLFSYFQ